MKTTLTRLTLLLTSIALASFALASCSTTGSDHNMMTTTTHSTMTTHEHHQMMMASNGNGEPMQGPSGMRVGMMDDMDQNKLSHALDKGAGKSTHWTNGSSGVSYTVTPGSISAINGNPYCRHYTITTMHGNNKHETSGSACVSNGVWQTV